MEKQPTTESVADVQLGAAEPATVEAPAETPAEQEAEPAQQVEAVAGPSQEAEPETEPAATPDSQLADQPSLEQLLAEAEERGYVRGLNARIEELMRAPAVLESIVKERPAPKPVASDPLILNHMRPSVWDVK